MNDMFPSKWLAAADLHDTDQTLTVSEVGQEVVGQGDDAETKWVVYFTEVSKGLVLNKTNATSLSLCLGLQTEDWIGQRAVLYPTQVQFNSKMVDAIRVSEKKTRNANNPQAAAAPARPKPQPARPKQPTPADEDDEDSVPF